MRCIKSVLVAAAAVVMIMALTAGTVLAGDNDCHDFYPFDRFFFDGGFASGEV